MPWRANVVYSAPTDDVIAAFRRLGLGDALYVVRDLFGIRFEWVRERFFGTTRGDICHGLPARGLLAVMPPFGRSNYDDRTDWTARANVAQYEDAYGDHPATKWETAGFAGRRSIPELGGHEWPTGLHEALSKIARTTGETSIHYFCETSGGPPDIEAAMVVAPEGPSLFARNEDPDHDPLVQALTHLGLVLPTGFFALHEGSFDWSRYVLDKP